MPLSERFPIFFEADGLPPRGVSPQTSLESGPDRFNLREGLVPIELKNLEMVQKLRRSKLLPVLPNGVIANEHEELAMDLDLKDRKLGLDDLAQILSSLKLQDRRTSIDFGPIISTLDIYVVREGISQRLRYYLDEGGRVQSSRIITAVGDGSSSRQWFSEDPKVVARQECVLVEREDTYKDEQDKTARIKHNTRMFFNRHKDFGVVSALVYKRVLRGNFGEKTMWSHKHAAIRGDLGEESDVFETDAVLAMGDYLNFVLQEVRKFSSTSLVLDMVLLEALKVVEGIISPERFFKDLTRTEPLISPSIRIEIECKGDHFQNVEGPLLTHELISPGRILATNHIGWKIAQGRKIKSS